MSERFCKICSIVLTLKESFFSEIKSQLMFEILKQNIDFNIFVNSLIQLENYVENILYKDLIKYEIQVLKIQGLNI